MWREAGTSRKQNRASPLLLTTTAALGHSSMYSRTCLLGRSGSVTIAAGKGVSHFRPFRGIFESTRGCLSATRYPYVWKNPPDMGRHWDACVAGAVLGGGAIRGNVILSRGVQREVYPELAEGTGQHRHVQSSASICTGETTDTRSARASAKRPSVHLGLRYELSTRTSAVRT